MVMRIIWSAYSRDQLHQIFLYLSNEVNRSFALKYLADLKAFVNVLQLQPYMGQKEELLLSSNKAYRYIVCKNYKIIYSVDEALNVIRITNIFDCRQNPQKMKLS